MQLGIGSSQLPFGWQKINLVYVDKVYPGLHPNSRKVCTRKTVSLGAGKGSSITVKYPFSTVGFKQGAERKVFNSDKNSNSARIVTTD